MIKKQFIKKATALKYDQKTDNAPIVTAKGKGEVAKNIIKIAMGQKFVVALDNMGKVYTWGQYKANDTSYHEKPYQMSDMPYILDVDANAKYGYGVTNENKIIRWSSDLKNQETFEIKANYEELDENAEKS